jgi:uncharacterized iron-regulated membrane protein
MTFRSFIFWPHLVAGVLAGSIIFIMSVTGVLLTYEKQMLTWADGSVRIQAANQSRLPIDELISRIRVAHSGALPSAITMSSAVDAPALATIRQTTWLVDPYSGATLGESAPRLRRFFRVVTDWHRWLAVGGENRQAARAVTGWANLLFLFIVVSGMYLWLPRRWSWRHVKSVAVINPRLSGKTRDFNWHNAIGIWSAIPLFFVVLSITPISFPWANALIFRLVGEPPPPRAAQPPRQTAAVPVTLDGLDAGWRLAEQQVAGWRAISMRVPTSPDAPLAFTIDRGTGGQPQLRGTLTVNRATGQVARWEPFESQSLGRRVRSIARFLHTGEVLGIVGQTIAGLVSLGAAFLVFTGLALAYRRFFSRARAENGRARAAA